MPNSSTDWTVEIGRAAESSIRELVDALTNPYTRENTKAEDAQEAWEDAGESEAWTGADDQWTTALEHLNASDGRDATHRMEKAVERIQEDALSLEVRSDWVGLGDEMEPSEFCILLATGGPAYRIRGTLGRYAEPDRAWLEVQDWGKPWTQYFGEDPSGLADSCLAYARCFCWEGGR